MSTTEKWYRFRELPPDVLLKIEQLGSVFSQADVLLAYLFGSHAPPPK